MKSQDKPVGQIRQSLAGHFQGHWLLFWDNHDRILNSIKLSESHSVVSDSLQPHGLYNPWNSPGQNTGVGSLSLLQGIFPTQGLNPGLLHCRWILYQLTHEGSPRILEWVAYPISSRSSQCRNWTGVSCIEGGLFNSWATREKLKKSSGGNFSTLPFAARFIWWHCLFK